MMGSTAERLRTAPKAGWLATTGLLAAGMVMLLVAPALACTGIGGSLTLSPDRGPIGTEIRIEGTRLDPNAHVDISWNGVVVTTATASEVGVFQATVVVPQTATVRPGRSVAYYQITAQQTKADGTKTPPATETFMVTAPAAQPPPLVQEPGPEPIRNPGGPSPVPATGGNIGVTAPVPVASGANPTAAPVDRRVEAPASPGRAAVGPAVPGVPAVTSAEAPPPAVAVTPASDESASSNQDLLDVAGVVSEGDLWSGLDAAEGPSLIDLPAPVPQRGLPVGTFAFGIGIGIGIALLGLVGLGLAAGRRRAHAPTGR